MSNQNKNIAIVISDMGSGGAQKIVSSLIGYLIDQGHTLTLITLDDGKSDFFKAPEQCARIALDLQQNSTGKLSGIFANLKRIRTLRRAIKKTNCDTVISFIAPTNILTILATRFLNVKVIISERNDPARQSYGRFWDWAREKTYRYADMVSANSKNAIEHLNNYVPKDKLFFIPNHLNKAEQPYIVKQNNKAKVILSVGRLHHQKAMDTLIKAFAEFHKSNQDWHLKILGQGSLENELKELSASLNLDEAIQFEGVSDNPYEYYKEASVFALASRHEGTPNALLEAMSCGVCPVISNACTEALAYIENKKSGIVFPVDDVSALANALDSICNDLPARQEYADQAMKNVEALNAEHTLKEWDKLINKVNSK